MNCKKKKKKKPHSALQFSDLLQETDLFFFFGLMYGLFFAQRCVYASRFWNSRNILYAAKSHWTVQCFIQANEKTHPLPLLVNFDFTPSIVSVVRHNDFKSSITFDGNNYSWEEYYKGNCDAFLTPIQNGACTLCHACSSLTSMNTMH